MEVRFKLLETRETQQDHTAQTTCLFSHLWADPGICPHSLLQGERQMEAREMNEGAVNHGNVTP